MIIEKIAQSTKIDAGYIMYLARSASHRYKIYDVSKRKGGKRRIAHPSRELKFLQRWLTRNVVSKFPVHPAAAAYRSGLNISHVANLHKNHNYLLLMDFEDFFQSIKYEDIYRFLKEKRTLIGLDIDDADCDLVGRVLTRFGVLPIGAPSSPAVSNAIMFEFDELVSGMCRRREVCYSRYADDLQFSTDRPNQLSNIFSMVKESVAAWGIPALRINQQKTVFTSRKRRRMVVGLILTSSKRISVGREQKRRIKSLVFRYKQGQLRTDEISYLVGYLAFLNSVEPSFIGSLARKYGQEVLGRLRGPVGDS